MSHSVKQFQKNLKMILDRYWDLVINPDEMGGVSVHVSTRDPITQNDEEKFSSLQRLGKNNDIVNTSIAACVRAISKRKASADEDTGATYYLGVDGVENVAHFLQVMRDKGFSEKYEETSIGSPKIKINFPNERVTVHIREDVQQDARKEILAKLGFPVIEKVNIHQMPAPGRLREIREQIEPSSSPPAPATVRDGDKRHFLAVLRQRGESLVGAGQGEGDRFRLEEGSPEPRPRRSRPAGTRRRHERGDKTAPLPFER